MEYIARGPLSNERVEITDSGNVRLKLKSAFHDGTTHLLFTSGEFIEKLSAIIPPPKTHLVKWSGVFAPNSKHRKMIVLKPDNKKGIINKENFTSENPLKNYPWAKMLARVFQIDISVCDRCGGEMRVMGAITDTRQAARYLRHVGIDHEAPSRAPPRYVEEFFAEESFDAKHCYDDP